MTNDVGSLPLFGREGSVSAPIASADSVRWEPFLFFIAAIVVVAAVARSFHFHRGSSWEDEIIAITHANRPLP